MFLYICILFYVWVKSKCIYCYLNFRCLCGFLVVILVYNGGVLIWWFYIKFYKVVWSVLINILEMMYCIDFRIGEVFYKCVFYNFLSFWFILLNGLNFVFLLWDSENDFFIMIFEFIWVWIVFIWVWILFSSYLNFFRVL